MNNCTYFYILVNRCLIVHFVEVAHIGQHLHVLGFWKYHIFSVHNLISVLCKLIKRNKVLACGTMRFLVHLSSGVIYNVN